MIRETVTVSELRLFNAAAPAPMAMFDASCLLVWEAPKVVWLRMMQGRMSRSLLKELVLWLSDHGVQTAKAFRAEGHVLPWGVEQADGSVVMSVDAAVARYTNRTKRG